MRRLRALALFFSALPGLIAPSAAAADPRLSPGAAAQRSVYKGIDPTVVDSSSRITAARTQVEIGPVLQGDVVQHEFVIPNESDRTIDLRSPQMCPACVLESYTSRIRAGEEGHLRFSIPTDWLGGQSLVDTIVVRTTSTLLPEIEIEVDLTVRLFARVSPSQVWLEGGAEERVSERCVVVPAGDFPFEITQVRAGSGRWFEHKLAKVDRDGRSAFEIRVQNTRTKRGTYHDTLYVQTDHPDRPEFKISVVGRID